MNNLPKKCDLLTSYSLQGLFSVTNCTPSLIALAAQKSLSPSQAPGTTFSLFQHRQVLLSTEEREREGRGHGFLIRGRGNAGAGIRRVRAGSAGWALWT